MRQHKLALCKEHYLEWIPEQTERFIKKYEMFTHYEKVLVAVSGGKDSLALWEILTRLDYQADGLYIGLGIDGGFGYSSESHWPARSRSYLLRLPTDSTSLEPSLALLNS